MDKTFNSSANQDLEFYQPNFSILSTKNQDSPLDHYAVRSSVRIERIEESQDRNHEKPSTAHLTKILQKDKRGHRGCTSKII